MPLTTESLRRLQKKTSQTMLGAQRRSDMETNRLTKRLAELQAVEDRRDVARQREFRQAARQLSLASLTLSDNVINVDDISGHRPRAPSSADRRRAMERIAEAGGEAHDGADGTRRHRRPRQRRPQSVFAPQVERQRELLKAEAGEAVKDREAWRSDDGQQQQQQQQQQHEPHPAPSCLFAEGGAPCRRFPCCLPPSYIFISSKREMLQLYDLLLSQLPEHRRPASGSDIVAGSDLGSMISDAEYLIDAQRRVSTLDPVERARLLRQASQEWRRKHSGQQPQPRDTRYGKPYPMRRILKPISCSTSFFLK